MTSNAMKLSFHFISFKSAIMHSIPALLSPTKKSDIAKYIDTNQDRMELYFRMKNVESLHLMASRVKEELQEKRNQRIFYLTLI